MAYDETSAGRIREMLESNPSCLHGLTEQRMFGGLCFMIHGNMCCGVVGDDLVLRLGKELTSVALEEPNTRPMNFTGRVLSTMVYVDLCAVHTQEELRSWIDRAVRFSMTFAPK